MSSGVLIAVIAVFAVGALAALAVLLDLPILGRVAGRADMRGNIRTMVQSQRQVKIGAKGPQGRTRESVFDVAKDAKVSRVADSRLTLRKKLKFGRWNIPPLAFRVGEISLSLVALSVTSMYFNLVIQGLSLMSGPLLMRWLLNTSVERRFKAFDADYPAFLSQVVSLLKTGMNVTAALEAAAGGLEDGSLVRQEVELMVERLRFGVSEDKSIGSFGEDVYHPEIELFVQALLLGRRVGGTLSDTLERLGKQVRKRQYFRKSAAAAVSMQRGSIWFILAILAALEVYLYIVFPEAVTGAMADPLGWQVWQAGLLLIALGMFWVRQVTKIRI